MNRRRNVPSDLTVTRSVSEEDIAFLAYASGYDTNR